AYQDYTIRARVSEAAVLASAAKATVTENIANNGGAMPADACAGVDTTLTATKNVASMTCTAGTGAIAVVTSAAAGGVPLTFTPTVPAAGGAIGTTWSCVGTGAAKHLPAECR